ncbi:hypothetical protein F511_35687 [Dorcoceras hygrometricum]|uniref:Uncharacterized protein n=1 Tax=Dorcoceras hygrometricum TaxID=472368 RepID=A0A2Z7ARW5_9LAMI|nr:hypothetical protein F511_35687 [Dorcoceras hygrometricum]
MAQYQILARKPLGHPGQAQKSKESKNSIATPPRVHRTAAARRRPPLEKRAAATVPACGGYSACESLNHIKIAAVEDLNLLLIIKAEAVAIPVVIILEQLILWTDFLVVFTEKVGAEVEAVEDAFMVPIENILAVLVGLSEDLLKTG